MTDLQYPWNKASTTVLACEVMTTYYGLKIS